MAADWVGLLVCKWQGYQFSIGDIEWHATNIVVDTEAIAALSSRQWDTTDGYQGKVDQPQLCRRRASITSMKPEDESR